MTEVIKINDFLLILLQHNFAPNKLYNSRALERVSLSFIHFVSLVMYPKTAQWIVSLVFREGMLRILQNSNHMSRDTRVITSERHLEVVEGRSR